MLVDLHAQLFCQSGSASYLILDTSVICLQTISSLKDEIRELRQKIQNQDSKMSAQTLENQELQEKLDLQQRYTHKQGLTLCSFSC